MRRRNLFLAATAAALLAVGLYGCNSPSTSSSSSPPADGGEMDHAEHGGEMDHAEHGGEMDHAEAGGEMDHAEHAEHDDSQAEHAEHAGQEHGDQAGGDMSPMEKMKEVLAKLPEADRAAAEKQHFCPVSGKMLGTMGLPIKVEANGQNAWICCGGCEEKFTADPETYLAKLNKE